MSSSSESSPDPDTPNSAQVKVPCLIASIPYLPHVCRL